LEFLKHLYRSKATNSVVLIQAKKHKADTNSELQKKEFVKSSNIYSNSVDNAFKYLLQNSSAHQANQAFQKIEILVTRKQFNLHNHSRVRNTLNIA